MSPGSRLAALGALAGLAAVLGGSSARADVPLHTYSIENVDAFPDKVFVAWPRTCGSTGDPLGAVSLQLNPDWAARQHEVDYEVIRQGAAHQVMPYCLATMRIFALSAAAFPLGNRLASGDDGSLGKKPGETVDLLPALDALELPKRVAFFADDSRKVASPFRFDAPLAGYDAGPAVPRGVHRGLVIEGAFDASPPSFTLVTKHVKLTFDKPTPDVDLSPADAFATPLAGDGGPGQPDRGRADAGMAAAPAPPPEPVRGDGGTRWVYAAAIGGLLAGGLIAHYRKKDVR